MYVNDEQEFSVELLWVNPRWDAQMGFVPLPLEKRPLPDTHRVERTVSIAAPTDRVWNLVTDHRGMPKWFPVDTVTLEREGHPAPNGVGAERAMRGPKMNVREQVLGWDPQRSLDYRLMEGAPISLPPGSRRVEAGRRRHRTHVEHPVSREDSGHVGNRPACHGQNARRRIAAAQDTGRIGLISMGAATGLPPPQRVFITGANGFIGRALAQRYRSLGAEVCGIDFAADPAWNVVAGDVRRPEGWRNQLAGVDLVIHTAAVVSMVAPMRAAWDVNCNGTRKLLTACREQGVARFVQLSSVAAFGFDFPANVDESHPLITTGNSYVDTKIASEHAVLAAHARRRDRLHHHPAGRRLRPGIAGVGDRAAGNDACAVNSCFLTPGRAYSVPSTSTTCVDGIVLAAGKPEGAGQIFTLTSGIGVSCAEFFGHHWRWLGKPGSPRTLPKGLAIALAEAGASIAHLFGRSTELGRGSVELLGAARHVQHRESPATPGVLARAWTSLKGMRRSEAWAREKGLLGAQR